MILTSLRVLRAFGVLCLLLEIFLSYRQYAAVLKFTTLSLFAYVAVVFTVHVPWGAALKALVLACEGGSIVACEQGTALCADGSQVAKEEFVLTKATGRTANAYALLSRSYPAFMSLAVSCPLP